MRLLLFVALAFQLASCTSNSNPRNTNWELLGNSSEMQHHSDLTAINDGNIDQLDLAWSVDMPSLDGMIGNPLVKNGVVFQSGALGKIFANDLRTGRQLWVYEPEQKFSAEQPFVRLWGARTNRGAALWQDLVIASHGDCHLVALDQKSGRERWMADSCSADKGLNAITGAPRVGGDMVFVGNACGDLGTTRGYVDAFDARTGKRRWRFYTVPGDPAKPQEDAVHEMAARSWGTGWHAKSVGCGSVWDSMTYDEKLGLLYIGVGGPSPFDPSLRAKDAGDELFTNSIVALNAKTGKYVWHFKQTPHDGWNYEPLGIMVADLPINGAQRRVVIGVPKSGFVYVNDARTGAFISGKNYTTVNWTKGLNAKGRPIPDPAARYWERPNEDTVLLPGPLGSHGWEALAFDPREHLLYIPVMVMPTLMKADPTSITGGQTIDYYYGSSGKSKWKAYGEVVAWDPIAQKERWRERHDLPINGGLLQTSGNLLFQGLADGTFEVRNAATGKILWQRDIGGAVRAAPSTVMLDGVQYVIVASGNGATSGSGYISRYSTTPQSRTTARLLAFKLGGTASYPKGATAVQYPEPGVPRQEETLARVGRGVFEAQGCYACHGYHAESLQGSVPDLRRNFPADIKTFRNIVKGGALSPNGMPRFKNLSEEDLRAAYAFIVNSAWDAHGNGAEIAAGRKAAQASTGHPEQ